MVSDLIKKLQSLDSTSEIYSYRGDSTCAKTFDFEVCRVYELSVGRGLYGIIDFDDVTQCEYVEKHKRALANNVVIL